MTGERKAGALGRTVGQADTYPAFANSGHERASSTLRADAFALAERHSRRVRRLKVVLPALALVMVAGFALYSFATRPGAGVFETRDAAVAEGKLVMDSPKLEGFTKDGRSYSVSAARAIQDIDRQDVINLDGIDATMPVERENWARVQATSGVYDRMANTLDVPSDIVVTTNDGLVARLKSAFLDISGGTLRSSTPVDIRSHGSRITADSMAVLDNGGRVVFEPRVRVYIDLEQLKAAQAARGEANASN